MYPLFYDAVLLKLNQSENQISHHKKIVTEIVLKETFKKLRKALTYSLI
jgi:hypothetical protein